ncbi:serine protease 33-like [Eriocheir sinensis]|uniref:serine protease 33-like n=1 Tax=Eriocheir sinensis TaxID=95602 RepID=UPI0021C87F1F|nr:serine protease 33-like [Eriocheir sinensis]
MDILSVVASSANSLFFCLTSLLLLTGAGAGRRADFRHGGFPKFPVLGGSALEVSKTGGGQKNVHVYKTVTCGRVATPRIVGGGAAAYGNHPWQAVIEMYRSGEGFIHHCGGVIISSRYVLTAAHCLQNFGLSRHDYRIKVGDHNLGKPDQDEQMFEIEDLVIHPKFAVGGQYNNDVAVLKVREQRGEGFRMSRFVTPACLPAPDTSYTPGISCQVSGWGFTDPNNDYSKPKVLHSTDVLLVADKECQQLHGTRGYGPGMVCAGHPDGIKDACNADSGGPLACNINGSYTVFGLVSWGKGCGKPGLPGVYTHIQYYVDWINSVTGNIQ